MDEIAKLKKMVDEAQARILELEKENADLRSVVSELQAKDVSSQVTITQLKSANATLEAEKAASKRPRSLKGASILVQRFPYQ